MGGGLAFVLITFGVLIDLIQAFLDLLFVGIFLNWALDAIAVLGFSIMLYGHGGNVLSRRGVSFGFSTLFELIPVLNAIPVWTAFAIRTVVAEKMREGKMAPPIENHRVPRFGKWRL